MHPSFRQDVLRERERELDGKDRRGRLGRSAAPAAETPTGDPLVLRLCCVADDGALDRLAELEGRPAPRGRHVVAEVAGEVVAALPLAGGEPPLTDPFVPTAHLLPLLELRARQIRGERAPSRRLGLLLAARRVAPARR